MNSIPSEQASKGPSEVTAEADNLVRELWIAGHHCGRESKAPLKCDTARNALIAYISNLESSLAEQREDAKRLDWLEANYCGVDFAHGAPGEERVVLLIECPKRTRFTASLRSSVDFAISETPPGPTTSGKAFFGADPIVGEE